MEKENNNSLEASKRIKVLFEAIWDNSSIAIYETDADGQCLSVNDEWCKFAGISKEDALGDGWKQGLHPDDKERIFSLWTKHAKTKKPWNFEYRFQTPENIITWVLGTANPILNKQGEITGYIGVNSDITERKQKQEEVAAISDQWQATFDSVNDAIWLLDKEHRILRSNKKAELLFGKDNIGKKCFEIVHGTDCPVEGCPVQLAFMEKIRKSMEFQIGNNWYKISADPILDANGNVTSAVHIVRDITVQRKVEDALRASEKHFRSIIENTSAGYFFVDNEGLFQKVNKAWLNLYKYENFEEVIGKHYAYVQQIDDLESAQDFVEGIKNGNLDHMIGDFSRKCKDGSIGYHSFSARPVYADGKITGVEGFIIDITKQKQAEKALKESEKQLKELNTFKNKLFSIIAHDLRSPLNNILGFSKLLIEKIKTSDIEEATKFATIINTSTKNDLDLLDSLLTWGNTQTDRIEFAPKNLKLIPIVEEVFSVLNLMASPKNIKLINSLSDDIVVYADPNMLSTILRNLIANAIKFTNSEGIVHINAVSQQDHIEISVTDNGVGINDENKKKLFGADLSFTMRGTQNESGSGLGLVLCKEFVEKHQGKIWVESEVGKGSVFRFTLPCNSELMKLT